MKTIILSTAFLLLGGFAQAEYRSIAIEVFKAEGAKQVRVNIHSEVEKENKRELDLKSAVAIVERAMGWGSSVGVVIVTENVALSEYIDLVNAVAKNGWMELSVIQPKRQGARHADHILRHYKISTKD